VKIQTTEATDDQNQKSFFGRDIGRLASCVKELESRKLDVPRRFNDEN